MNNMTDFDHRNLTTKVPARVRVAVVRDVGVFMSLRHTWNALLQRSRQKTVFLTWDWLFTWWEFFSDADHALNILLIYADDELVGIAPLQIQKCGFRKVKILRFIGIGEPIADQVVSEYLDVIALPEWEALVSEQVAEWLCSNGDWVHFECDDVKQDFLIWDVYQSVSKNYMAEVIPKRRAFTVPLAKGDEYRERLSASRRKRLARSQRALTAAGGMQQHSINDASDIDRSLQALVDLHQQRWHSKDKRGVFDSERFTRFHRRILELLWPKGQAGVEIFSVNDEQIAALYCLYTDDTAYYYQSGFATNNANKFMPLANAHMMEIERNQNAGRQYYDLMRGASDSYKSDYGCDEVQLYTLHLFRRTFEHRYYLYRAALGERVSALLNKVGVNRH